MRLWELWKGFASRTNMDYMRLLNDLDWEQTSLKVPCRLALEPIESDVFSLFNTKHLRRNAQSCIGTSSPALRHWCGKSATSGYLKAWLSSLAFDPCLPSGHMPGEPKVQLYVRVLSGLSHCRTCNRFYNIMSWQQILLTYTHLVFSLRFQ